MLHKGEGRKALSKQDMDYQITQILDLVRRTEVIHLNTMGIDGQKISASTLRNVYTPNERQAMLEQLLSLNSGSPSSITKRLNRTSYPIKATKSFTEHTVSEEDRELIDNILSLAKEFDIKVIAGFEDVPLNKPKKLSVLMTSELEVLLELIREEIQDKGSQQMVSKILHLADEISVEVIPGFEDIDLLSISEKELRRYSRTEHDLMLRYLWQQKEDNEVVDQILELVEKLDIDYLPTFNLNFMKITINELRNKITKAERLAILQELKSLSNQQKIDGKNYPDSLNYNTSRQTTEAHFGNSELQRKIILKVNELGISSLPDFPALDFLTLTMKDLEDYTEPELKMLLAELHSYEMSSMEIDRIIFLAKEMNLQELPDFDIDFQTITDHELRYVNSKEDRELIITTLERLFDQTVSNPTDLDLINPLEVIEKYRSGAIIEEEDEKGQENSNNEWRKNIPGVMKLNIRSWNTDSLDEFYRKAKDLMNSYQGGKELETIRAFVCDLSEIVFEQKQEEEDEEDWREGEGDDDGVSAAILSLVEMIILPHHEVLERIEERGGQILFSDIWSQPFNDTLKNAVKDRDGWACVICGADKGLHVHHKIPRKFGGVNHKDNLVTLCHSCHPAIETADIKHAYTKCLANYWKNRNKRMIMPVAENKTQLKQEVEASLDSLVVALSNRKEDKLVEEVLGVMKRLEVIFYD
ncbi:hypothetical protein J2S74_000744 [Evansella vedderi]|uniref:HNH nuclease domain-containing protein n=1 Tax=Evansella vedderi TaxID=38282 RepID=A0ABT9ZQ55_9BACI|nr:HNH endonuclease [Evansella vedderi]MDQ0253372.1 hypothetical protein [Evansella vedderi]